MDHGKSGYSTKQRNEFSAKFDELTNKQISVAIDLFRFSGELKVNRAAVFANEGIGRRLQVIARAVTNIYSIYPPDRENFLTKDECTDIAIQLHAFAINLCGIFDNIAWVITLEAGRKLDPVKIGLFKAECQRIFPESFRTYLANGAIKVWFNEYGKLYRDSTAHRIAPYLPSKVYTADEGQKWERLHQESINALTGWSPGSCPDQTDERLALNEKLEMEKESLGSNSLLVGLSLTGEDASPPVYLHPQLLCDWGLVHELIAIFVSAMRAQVAGVATL